MNSCLYECRVMHARFPPSPRAHRFLYRIFLFAIDLDELDVLHRRLALFSVNRANLYSFRERDFLADRRGRFIIVGQDRRHPRQTRPPIGNL